MLRKDVKAVLARAMKKRLEIKQNKKQQQHPKQTNKQQQQQNLCHQICRDRSSTSGKDR